MKTQSHLKDFFTKSGGNKFFSNLIKSTIDKSSKKRPLTDFKSKSEDEVDQDTDKNKRVFDSYIKPLFRTLRMLRNQSKPRLVQSLNQFQRKRLQR